MSLPDWTAHWHGRCEQRPLGPLTTMGVGGPALLAEVADQTDLALARQLTQEVSARWLGRGANLLIGPDGVPEPVFKLGPAFAHFEVSSHHIVRVGGAFDLARLVGRCAKAGLAGLEVLAGVPASVGGALFMNAGTNHGWIDDCLQRALVWLPDRPEPEWLSRDQWPSVYRSCGLPRGTICLEAEFALRPDEPAAIQARVSELKQAKARSQPLAAKSAGCIFKNPRPDAPAGQLIDRCGLKGLREGGAVVSEQHANFIINEGGGKVKSEGKSAADAAMVCRLIKRIRRQVYDQTGEILELEVQTWNLPADVHAHPSSLLV